MYFKTLLKIWKYIRKMSDQRAQRANKCTGQSETQWFTRFSRLHSRSDRSEQSSAGAVGRICEPVYANRICEPGSVKRRDAFEQLEGRKSEGAVSRPTGRKERDRRAGQGVLVLCVSILFALYIHIMIRVLSKRVLFGVSLLPTTLKTQLKLSAACLSYYGYSKSPERKLTHCIK